MGAFRRARCVFRETEEDNVGGMIPFGDASRRPRRFPAVTTVIIVVNALVFVLELVGGDAFVQQWSVIPADIVAGRHWITILTAMFMHAGCTSWAT
jgi:membrane associated rhomboid family serine protease